MPPTTCNDNCAWICRDSCRKGCEGVCKGACMNGCTRVCKASCSQTDKNICVSPPSYPCYKVIQNCKFVNNNGH